MIALATNHTPWKILMFVVDVVRTDVQTIKAPNCNVSIQHYGSISTLRDDDMMWGYDQMDLPVRSK